MTDYGAAYHRERRRTRYDRLRARGLCIQCGQSKHAKGRIRCSGCLAKARQSDSKRRAEGFIGENGMYANDRQKERDAARARDRGRYHRRKDAGLCVWCEGTPQPGKTYCPACLERMSTYYKAFVDRATAKGLCRRCRKGKLAGRYAWCISCRVNRAKQRREGV
jgi:hypothetical protein